MRIFRSYEQFLLFPLCFQKTCTADTQKPGLVRERVKANPKYCTHRSRFVAIYRKKLGTAVIFVGHLCLFYESKSLHFLCPCIDRLVVYYCTVVCLSACLCLSVCLLHLSMYKAHTLYVDTFCCHPFC